MAAPAMDSSDDGDPAKVENKNWLATEWLKSHQEITTGGNNTKQLR